MSNTPTSGLSYPNRGARALVLGLEDLVGKHGLELLLKRVGLEEWTENIPPENIDQDVDFAQLTALSQGLLEFYGRRSGSGLARQANRSRFDEAWGEFGELADFKQDSFSTLPVEEKIEIGGKTLARVFNEISDLGLRFTTEHNISSFELENCPYCFQVKSDVPTCGAAVGWIEGFLGAIGAERQIIVHETACAATGAPHCVFTLHPSAEE
ncbi:MAG: 4-vinyl reductase [Anaerolineales bacterium]